MREQVLGPEVCEGKGVEDCGGGGRQLEADSGGQGCRELSLKVEGGGGIRAPASPVRGSLGLWGDAEGDEGGCTPAAKAVEGELGGRKAERRLRC